MRTCIECGADIEHVMGCIVFIPGATGDFKYTKYRVCLKHAANGGNIINTERYRELCEAGA